MKKFIRKSLLIATLLTSSFAASCHKEGDSGKGDTCPECPKDNTTNRITENTINHTLVVDHEDIKLLVGETGVSKQIKLTVTPSTDNITYSSTDTSVATVSNTGEVVGVKANASCEIIIKGSSGIEKRLPVTTYDERTYFTYTGGSNKDTLISCIDKDVVELTLPKWYGGDESSAATIKYLDTRALWGLSRLKKLVIPEGYTNIKSESLVGLVSLEEVIFPSTITNIEEGAFYNCPNIKSIKFRNETTDSETGGTEVTLVNSNSANTYTVSDAMENGSQVLYSSGSTKTAIVGFNKPNGLLFSEELGITNLGHYSYYGLESLVDVETPSTVKKFGRYVFSSKSLKSINILCNMPWDSGQMVVIGAPFVVNSPNLETLKGVQYEMTSQNSNGEYVNSLITLATNSYFRAATKNFNVSDDDTFSGRNSNGELNNVTVKCFDDIFLGMGLTGVFKIPSFVNSIRTRAFQFNSELKGIYIPKGFTYLNDRGSLSLYSSSDNYEFSIVDPETGCPIYIPKLLKGRTTISPFFGCHKDFKIYYQTRDDGKSFAEVFASTYELLQSEYPNFEAIEVVDNTLTPVTE